MSSAVRDPKSPDKTKSMEPNDGSNNSSPDNHSKKSTSPAPQKALYLFSNIFEKQEDITNQPFVFEKHNLKKRAAFEELGPIKMQSFLIRPKKQCKLS